jgi:hypothetical protein
MKIKSKMEYNLLKTIETNYGYTGEDDIIMTPFPSEMSIIPGIGQVINNLSIIVPLYNTHELTNVTKKCEFESEKNQLGLGNETEILDKANDHVVSDSDNKPSETSIPFNDNKKRLLDESVYESFMHPKMFKTNSIILDNSKVKKAKTETSTKEKLEKTPSDLKIKHKFNVM